MKLLAIVLSICTALPVQAGGPVIIEEPVVEEGNPAVLFSPGETIALAAGLILLGALVSSGGGSGGGAIVPGGTCSCFTEDEGGTCTC